MHLLNLAKICGMVGTLGTVMKLGSKIDQRWFKASCIKAVIFVALVELSPLLKPSTVLVHPIFTCIMVPLFFIVSIFMINDPLLTKGPQWGPYIVVNKFHLV